MEMVGEAGLGGVLGGRLGCALEVVWEGGLVCGWDSDSGDILGRWIWWWFERVAMDVVWEGGSGGDLGG